jgi:hypothetical protein
MNNAESDEKRSFDEVFEDYWTNPETEQPRFDKDDFFKLSETMTTAVSPLKPLFGLFAFTAYDEDHPWSDNSGVFFWAWSDMVEKNYLDNAGEMPLLFIGFRIENRFQYARESWGLFATDKALYVSVSLWGDEAPRRYAYPETEAVPAGWASAFASVAVTDMDPEGIKQIAKLSNDPPQFDEDDNPKKWNFDMSTLNAEDVVSLIRAELTLALDTYIGLRGHMLKSKDEAARSWRREAEPVGLNRRVVELGLGEYIKFGTDVKQAKHFKKFADKLGMDSSEKIIFTFSDSTFAGIYGLAVTNRAIRSRDLMEEPVRQPIAPAEITFNEEEHTLTIGNGPIHHVGEFLPNRLMPALVTLLTEYLDGKIVV